MTYIKTYVPAYKDIITWSTIDIVNRFRKYDTLIGDGKSIDYINNILKSIMKKIKSFLSDITSVDIVLISALCIYGAFLIVNLSKLFV